VIELGRGQTDPKELFLKRGKGSYVVVFYEGQYFRQPAAERTIRQKNAIADDPLYEPLRKIGVDGPAIRRVLQKYPRSLIQRWLRITDAAMHEKPRGFAGFRVSPAAFFIDGVQNGRTAPDWVYSHEKCQERKQWEQARAASATDEQELRRCYDQERDAAFQSFLESPEGKQKHAQAFAHFFTLYQITEPHRAREAAQEATTDRLERLDFQFPEYPLWALTRTADTQSSSA
jgi:hypothetical protein